jgi:hypothetical protein
MWNLYVWEGVLADYTAGMAVGIGRTADEAIEAVAGRWGTVGTQEAIRADLRSTTPEVIPLRARGMKPLGWSVRGGG